MNGVIYCRVSSKDQIEGTSLESQELACREYARTHHLAILKVFLEQGESAKFADRTELLELIDFCRHSHGQVQTLLVWKLDRFARNVEDHYHLKATLARYGVRIVSVTEPIDPNPNGKLLETILAGFAQFDNEIRAMRTVQGMRHKIQDGLFPWKPPLGYVSASDDGEKKTLPDRPERPLFNELQKAWRLFATGAYTKADIRRLLASWGVMTRHGRPLGSQAVDHLFANSYYAGILIDPWSGEEYEGQHVPMVTREEFARVQQVIHRRARSIPHQKTRAEFPLRGIVRCRACQRYLTSSFSRGRSRRYPYYHCANRACAERGMSLPVADVHAEFATFLDRIALKPELLHGLGEMVRQLAREQADAMRAQTARREAGLKRLNREIQELIRMRMQELITDEEFRVQKARLQDGQTALLAGAHPGNFSVSKIEEQLSTILTPLTQLRATWEELPVELRTRFGQLVLPVGFVHGTIRTAELGLLFRLFGEFRDDNPHGVAQA